LPGACTRCKPSSLIHANKGYLVGEVFSFLFFCSTYHHWSALPIKRTLVMHSPYILPRCMFLDLTRDIICSMARFRICAHTLQVETVIWIHTSPTCAILIAYNVTSMSFSRTPIHICSLSAGLLRLCFLSQVCTMCLIF